jgi:hypothetical protein
VSANLCDSVSLSETRFDTATLGNHQVLKEGGCQPGSYWMVV